MSLTKVSNVMIKGAPANVLDYGAYNDGTHETETTVAIQNALDSGAKTIYVPKGTYLFTTLTIPEKVSLVGEGSANTILQTSTASNAITFNGTYNTQIKGLAINQTGSIQGKGLYLIEQYFVTLIDVTVTGFQYNLYAEKALYHYVSECKFENGTYGAYYTGSGTSWNIDWFNNVLTFQNCRFNGNATIGAYIKGCEVVFENCDWSGMSATNSIGLKVEGVNTSNYAHGIQIIQPYAETTDIIFSFSYAFVEINGGFVQGGTSSGTSAATSIIDADNYSSIFWKGRPRDSDYWDYGYRITNNSSLWWDWLGFSTSVRASNTVDATSSVAYGQALGTWTATLNGCTTLPTVTASYSISGKQVTINIPANNATSNSTGCTVTGLPTFLYPIATQVGYVSVFDTGAEYQGTISLTTSGVLTIYKGAYGGIFTNSGVKGHRPITFTYLLN